MHFTWKNNNGSLNKKVFHLAPSKAEFIIVPNQLVTYFGLIWAFTDPRQQHFDKQV